MSAEVRSHTDYARTVWKNGGGVTHEIAKAPPDAAWEDFAWRISCAEVSASGPFSAFPGVDRVILLVRGGEMVLTVDGVVHRLVAFEPLSFAGESVSSCEVSTPTLDINVMTRRGRMRACVAVVVADVHTDIAADPGTLMVLLALTDGVAVSGSDCPARRLDATDTVFCPGGESVAVEGGTVAVIRLRAVGAAPT